MFNPPKQTRELKGKAAFDFNKAVEEARQDYPRATKNATFVDLDAPDAMQQIDDWLEGLDDASLELLTETGTLFDMTPHTDGFTVHSMYGGKAIMATHSKYDPTLPFFPDAPEKQAAFVFFHELGHVVVPGADIPTNYSEQGADVFSALRGLSKGLFDKKDIKSLADARLATTLDHFDFGHLTTMALDAVVINPKSVDFLSLTPRQISNIAANHAEAFVNSADTERNIARATLSDFSAKGMFRNFADLALKAGKYSNEFYIAARMLKPLADANIKAEEIERMTDMTPAAWEKVKEALARKVGKRDIGGIEAVKNPAFPKPPEKLGTRILNSLKPLSI